MTGRSLGLYMIMLARSQGALTMRGLHKKGKNGPGLTGVQRVLNTRDRVQAVADPCRVSGCSIYFMHDLFLCCYVPGASSTRRLDNVLEVCAARHLRFCACMAVTARIVVV